MALVIALSIVIDNAFACHFFFSFFTVDLPIYFIEACKHGYYGENCTNTCWNCSNNQTCNNVNGTCIDGCSEGFKGDFCITGTVKKEKRFKESCVSTLNKWYNLSFNRGHCVRFSDFGNQYFYKCIFKSNKETKTTVCF